MTSKTKDVFQPSAVEAFRIWEAASADRGRFLEMRKDAFEAGWLMRGEVETKPARDADHCDYPDCEQHWRYVAQLAFNHVDMGVLRISHVKDWQTLNAAFGLSEKAPAPPGYWRCHCGEAHSLKEQQCPGEPSEKTSEPPSRRRAPWPDFAGAAIFEGDTIVHPGGQSGRVLFLEGSEHDAWRVDYGDGSPSRLCLQIGDKGRARVTSPR